MSAVQLLTAILIGLAVTLSSLRILLRTGPDRRWPQRGVLIALQVVAATLLWWTLFPPGDPAQKRTLTVLTAGAESVAPEYWAGDRWVVALPEVGSLADRDRAIERVPDLATALRDAPNLERIQIIGHGLPPRDRQVDEEIAIEFIAAARPPGLIELEHPDSVATGRPWSLRGRIAGQIAATPGASVVLRDPAGVEVARATSAAYGEFSLTVPGAPAGQLTYRLELLDAADQLVESLTIPVQVEPGAALRVALLSGAPNPELKYLRRWAVDAGLAVDSRIVLTRGAQLGDGPDRWDADNLSGYDLLVFDERAWADLNPAEQQAIDDAVQAGLGLLIRLTGQVSAALREQLAGLGFRVDEAKIARGVKLADDVTAVSEDSRGGATPVELARRPIQVSGIDAVALLRDTGAEPLGLWRGRGQGRVGLLWLSDSYRLVLAGNDAAHSTIWSDLFATLARGQAPAPPQWQTRHRWPHQRAVVCGLSAPADVLTPSAQVVRLVPDPAAGAEACAGFWPRQSGWHLLRHAGMEHAFYVHPDDTAAGLRAELDRAAMMQMIAARPAAIESDISAGTDASLSRWRWFLGWLLISALLWWCERRGRSSAGRPSKAGAG